RFFVPPNTDPIDPNYDPMIWRTAGLLGSAMAFDLQRAGHRGVLSNGLYDYYWPGYEDSAPLGHNTVCLLTEAASARVATPVFVSPGELQGGLRGLEEYRPRINFPDPWPGGRWSLRDIVDYEMTAVEALLRTAAGYREPIVRNFYEMGRRAVEAGRRGGPFAFVVAPDQRDANAVTRLREALLDGAVEVYRAQEAFRAGGETYPAGTDLIFMAQPFRAYAKTLLERQRYPGRLAGGAESERPYDVTGWTLPLQLGVDVRTVEQPFEPPLLARLTSAAPDPAPVWGVRRPGHYVIDGRGTSGALAATQLLAAGLAPSWRTAPFELDGFRFDAGAIVVSRSRKAEQAVGRIARELGIRVTGVRGRPPADTVPIGRARAALYRSWTDNADEGWVHWALERYGIPHGTLRDADLRRGSLRSRFDVIVLPSLSDDQIVSGNVSGFPAEYLGGIGPEGIEALRAFVDEGGTLVSLGEATTFARRIFGLPLEDVARDAGSRLVAPGSIVRLDADPAQPLAFGLAPQGAAFFSSSAAFAWPPAETAAPGGGRSIQIASAARYGGPDLLLSGYLEGESIVSGHAAVVDARVDRGRVVLIGFPPVHRGQTLATFRLLFNAILAAPGPDATSRRRGR
ncbi:MAG: hypothetical protein AB7I13_20900, partial [Vicinamibacterales bacterium]